MNGKEMNGICLHLFVFLFCVSRTLLWGSWRQGLLAVRKTLGRHSCPIFYREMNEGKYGITVEEFFFVECGFVGV